MNTNQRHFVVAAGTIWLMAVVGINVGHNAYAAASKIPTYYEELANGCQKKGSKNCCLASVKRMKTGNHTLVPTEGCPAGYQENMLKCIDSYRWCAPIETPAIDTQDQVP